MTPTRILAAVDQFPQDDAVLARALEIAALQGARLDVVHIVDLPGCGPDPARADALAGQAADAARARIGAALERLGAGGSDVEVRIETGSPALRLIAICDEVKPGLVVMRAHERARISERILGSTTERLVAAGQVPVLVVKREVDRPYGRVLIATDGKDDAAGAVALVAALLPGAALGLVRAVHIAPQLKEAMLRVGSDQAALTAHRDALAASARADLRALAASLTPRPTTRVLRGDPATALIRATRNPKVDLIVLGPGPTSLIRRAFIGSVTRRLLREGACDVLISCPEPPGD
jgi:nucleotide-binding universal stress UspA family protein